VVWVVESRRPDPELLASSITPAAALVAANLPTPAATPAPADGATGDSSAAATPETAAPPAAPTSNAAETGVYEVQSGDSLSAIATRLGVSVAAIMQANELENADFVFVGQRLLIPPAGSVAAETAATPAPTTAAITGGMKITAVDAAGTLDDEVVSLVNESDVAFNLQGWRVEREGGISYTFDNLPLFPGGGVLLYTKTGDDTSTTRYWNQESAVWQAGSVARLLDATGKEVARFPLP
jgi:LysM repeat protein